jgi:hypothetical protein
VDPEAGDGARTHDPQLGKDRPQKDSSSHGRQPVCLSDVGWPPPVPHRQEQTEKPD